MSDDSKISEKQEYINGLYKDYEYSISKFDHHILFLSSGILTICLTFIDQIVPLAEAKCISLFIASVIIATFTIMLSLASHYISSKLILKKINEAHSNIFDSKDDKIIPFLNASQLGAVILTIVVLSIFVITNILSTRMDKYIKQEIERGVNMAEKNNNKTQQVIIKEAMTIRHTPDSLIIGSSSKPTPQNPQSQSTATVTQASATTTTTDSNKNSK